MAISKPTPEIHSGAFGKMYRVPTISAHPRKTNELQICGYFGLHKRNPEALLDFILPLDSSRPNIAAQWRAAPDATYTNRHASARPLKQPSYTRASPCKRKSPLGLHPPFLLRREAHHNSEVAVNRTLKLSTGRSD